MNYHSHRKFSCFVSFSTNDEFSFPRKIFRFGLLFHDEFSGFVVLSHHRSFFPQLQTNPSQHDRTFHNETKINTNISLPTTFLNQQTSTMTNRKQSSKDSTWGQDSKRRKITITKGGSRVDEDDYMLVASMQQSGIDLSWGCGFDDNHERESNRERRIRFITFQGRPLCLPEQVGDLSRLEVLKVLSFGPLSLPPSIGMLQNLRVLNLSSCWNLAKIPQEIGNLENLEELMLNNTSISFLPDSIGNCKKLYKLTIGHTPIKELPDVVWDLSSLNFLEAAYTPLSIPPSIERLANLEILMLTPKGRLPTEFGNLTRLRTLCLVLTSSTRGYECVPFPVEHLQNLEQLGIDSNEWIDDAFRLDFFCGNYFPNLKCLQFPWKEKNSENKQKHIDFIVDLARGLPQLYYMGSLIESQIPQLSYILAWNRFRCRFLKRNSLPKKLWPLLMANGNRVFASAKPMDGDELSKRGVDAPNFVYKLLLERRGSFVQVLLDRNTNHNNSRISCY